MKWIQLFQSSVALHIEPNHLICNANQVTGFYMKGNTSLKWLKTIQFFETCNA